MLRSNLNQPDREPYVQMIITFMGAVPPMNIIRLKLIELKVQHKCNTTCRFNNKKELLIFPSDGVSEQQLMNNMPQFLFGNDVNYSTRSPRSINKTFSIVLKNADGTIDEKELLNDIQAIDNEVTAIHRIKNAALDKPTSLMRIDCATETCRDRLLAIRKLVVSPLHFQSSNTFPNKDYSLLQMSRIRTLRT
ncbi:unnamed protein product [Didymodactylos carnosus]|uniref:Uncharacterized protein n=1 Tax=Didymodactylos carnosus TaxID=1234261 RepID=A0A814VAF3_9BILA|nr:unnamed protein product [Didymodactylos carnosus]CAF3949697.1 unnamed protein product [Didymodactylos carnosus]